jgi:hypothetical protein
VVQSPSSYDINPVPDLWDNRRRRDERWEKVKLHRVNSVLWRGVRCLNRRGRGPVVGGGMRSQGGGRQGEMMVRILKN